LVKSAFDLYLPSLARTLGYKLPRTQKKRRKFWNAVSSMTLYFEPMDPTRYPSADSDPGIKNPEESDHKQKAEQEAAGEEGEQAAGETEES
jgi:hypothetical protein